MAASKAAQHQQQLMVTCSGSASEHTASSPSAATDDVYQTLSLADTASPQQVLMSETSLSLCLLLSLLLLLYYHLCQGGNFASSYPVSRITQ